MDTFRITSDVSAVFRSDLERFQRDTHRALERLLADPCPIVGAEAMNEAARHAHTLKGLGAMVGAMGLSRWGSDLERLWEVATTFLQTSREQAIEAVLFVCEQLSTWERMNELTLANDFDGALALYGPIRASMESRWGTYLVEDAPDTSDDADQTSPQEVNVLSRLLPSEVSRPALIPPAFKRRSPDEIGQIPSAEVVQGAPSEQTSEAAKFHHAPTQQIRPSVLAPALRLRISTQIQEVPGEVPAAETSPLPGGGTIARPSLISPPLKRKVEPATTSSESPASSTKLSRKKKRGRRPKNKVPATKTRIVSHEVTAESGVRIGDVPASLSYASGEVQKTEDHDSEMGSAEIEDSAKIGTLNAEFPIANTDTAQEDSARPSEERKCQNEVPEDTTLCGPVSTASEHDDLYDLLREESAGYLDQLAPLLNDLAANPNNIAGWEDARRLFHTIKGSAATVGIETVANAAKRGEAHCLVATESAKDRDRESVEACAARAAEVAAHLGVSFAPDLQRTATAQLPETVCEPLPDLELLAFFTAEALENANSVEGAVLRWERGENPAEQVASIGRAFHTIKGAANSIGLQRLGNSVHAAETAIEQASANSSTATSGLFAFLLRGVDQIRSYIHALEKGIPSQWEHDWVADLAAFHCSAKNDPVVTPAPSAPFDPAPANDERQLVRVENDRLHRLFDLAGEMVADRLRLQQNIERIRALQAQLGERNESLAGTVTTFQQQFEFNLLRDRNVAPRGPGGPAGDAAPGEFSELEFDRYDQFSILSRTLVELAHDVETVLGDIRSTVETLGTDDVRFTQTSRLLQQEITGLGMVPFSVLYPRLQRAFRDAAHSVAKKADLLFEGGGVQVDKVLTERIYAPLLHLLRNAVAHGVEDAETREALGKPARGQVRLSTTQNANQIVISLSDDGAGLNLPAIRARAIERGLLPSDTEDITTTQALEIIFKHGFSTAGAVTSVSGRGVGMDVVRREIEGLSGVIEYTAAEGQGATWTIRLPLNVSITEAIIADCAGLEVALPLNFVESGAIVDSDTIVAENGSETWFYQNQPLPVVRLRELLRLPGGEKPTRGIVVAIGGKRVVLLLDRVIARREIVVKNLDALLRQHPLLTGATLDTAGRVLPILNIPALLTYHESPASRRAANDGQRNHGPTRSAGATRVLIVDDSLSVRKVQERLLTGLGCHVTAAHDGLSAVERMRESRFDLIFTDLEMPRMNGYEFIAEVRANPLWTGVPVAVISSRGADKYISKAMALGANTFLSKPFTEEQLGSVLSHYAGWTKPGS
jgi:chemotaxis protein histidine kinase CheA